MAQNWWDQDEVVAPTPAAPSQAPGVIYGRPKAADPRLIQNDAISQANEAERLRLAREAAARETANQGRQASNDQITHGNQTFDNVAKFRSEFDAKPEVKVYRSALPVLMDALKAPADAGGDNSLIYAYAKTMDPLTGVREGEQAQAAGTDTALNASIAQLKKQFGIEGGGQLSPQARENLKRQINSRVAEYAKSYGVQRGRYQEMAQRYGFNPADVVGGYEAAPFMDQYEKVRPGVITHPDGSIQVGKDKDALIYNNADDYRNATGDDPPPPPDDRQKTIDAMVKQQEGLNGKFGIGDLVTQGATMGLADEATGVGNAIVSLLQGRGDIIENYGLGRDAYRQQLEGARSRLGGLGTAAEFVGGFGSMGGKAVNALAAAPATIGRAFRAGAVPGAAIGALSGFGSGEGLAGSTGNALLGAGAGAAIGGGINALAPAASALASRLPSRAARGTSDLGIAATPADVAAAGQAEGIAVPRAMVDPASRNRVTGVEATMAGGPIIQRGLGKVSQAIEDKAASLAQGGNAMTDSAAAGARVGDVAGRAIKVSGDVLGKRYDRAVQLSNGVRVNPVEANTVLDDSIARLSQTPETNSAELAYLEGLKSDLSKPLGVEALRDLRTTLRKKISKGDLVFGQNEARVLGVMDALSNDISNGLRSAGRAEAADLFTTTDRLYRERADFIQNTVQKLVGKRGVDVPPGEVMRRFKAMASPGGNEKGFSQMLKAMKPDERADISATFADALGKNNNGEFSVADFIKHATNLPQAARVNLFGTDGAQSIQNLIVLAKARKAVPFNASRTGVSNDYRSWLGNLAFGALGGAATGGGSAMTAAGGAAAMGAVKAGRDILTARALMSPKITKWIATAPRTSSPAAIDAHFRRLGMIAAQEPALAGEVQSIQQAIMRAANDNVSKAAVAGSENQDGAK